MAYDPNDPRSDPGIPPGTAPRDRPEVVNHIETRRSGPSWVPWVAILAVLLIGAFVWSNMGGTSGTDPDATDTATPPAVTDEAPEPAPAAPAPAEPAPPPTETAPAPAEPAMPGNDAAPADNGG